MTKATRLQVSISAKGLKNISGLLSKSDPFAIVTVRGDDPDSPQLPQIAGHTNVVFDNLNPSFSTVVLLEGYKFGVHYFIEVGIFDFDAKGGGHKETSLSRKQDSVTSEIIEKDVLANIQNKTPFPHKIMGSALFEVGEVLGSRGNTASKSFQTGGAVYLNIESSKDDGAQGKLRLKLGGLELPNQSSPTTFTSSPFFELYRRVQRPTGDVDWNNVYRSNVIKNNLDPVWDEVVLDLETLCNGDLERTIKIVVWAHRRWGKHKKMGELRTTVRKMIQKRTKTGSTNDFFALDNIGSTVAGIDMSDDSKAEGSIVVLEAEIMDPPGKAKTSVAPKTAIPNTIQFREQPSFVDYLTGGCQIHLTVAIDFTSSNGNPIEKGSLHYYREDEQEMNDYQKAIVAVGHILAPYDSDFKFPVWGFGATYNYEQNDCFQCGEVEEVSGIDGILEAYRNTFRTGFGMGKNTVITKVIRTAAEHALFDLSQTQEKEERLSYTILLLLTAGNVKNVDETVAELRKASRAPLSVVIVGIGDADFTAMEFLDGDERGDDITQFVRFNDYKDKNSLTAAVLDEVPDQLVDCFFLKGIMPGEPEQPVGEVKVQLADATNRQSQFFSTL
jgi:hypothetical protein